MVSDVPIEIVANWLTCKIADYHSAYMIVQYKPNTLPCLY